MKMKSLTFAVFVCVLLWTLTAAAVPKNKEHAQKVGKKGEITLAQPTTVGDKVLQPGTYVVQHRVSGGDHFVRFVELKTVERMDAETRFTYTEADKAGEIKCRVEPAPGPINETTVYTAPGSAGQRITKVAIKGEDVVHVL
jgi:hypothetical protein